MSLGTFTAPEIITADHDIADFDSGEPSLDEWLKDRALKNNARGGSRTFVVAADKRVVGYYCLSSSAVARAGAPKKLRHDMPDPLPAILLGRLAVDRQYQNRGLGKALLRDALLRTERVSRQAGVALIFVHALHERARQFYLSSGFVEAPMQPMTLMMTMGTVHTILTEPD